MTTKVDVFRSKTPGRYATVTTSTFAGRYSTKVTFTKAKLYRSSERTKTFSRRKDGLKAAREFVA